MRIAWIVVVAACASSHPQHSQTLPGGGDSPSGGATAGSGPSGNTQVAVGGDTHATGGDPCEGGEVVQGGTSTTVATAAGEGGGGTGDAVGLGNIGTSGGGAGAGHGGTRGAVPAPKVVDGEATVAGSLDKKVIRRLVRQRLGQLRFCYEKGLQYDPSLAGKVTAKFTIAPDGTVSAATATGLTDAVDDCIAGVFKRMEFPKPADGGSVEITYPFVFSPPK